MKLQLHFRDDDKAHQLIFFLRENGFRVGRSLGKGFTKDIQVTVSAQSIKLVGGSFNLFNGTKNAIVHKRAGFIGWERG